MAPKIVSTAFSAFVRVTPVRFTTSLTISDFINLHYLRDECPAILEEGLKDVKRFL